MWGGGCRWNSVKKKFNKKKFFWSKSNKLNCRIPCEPHYHGIDYTKIKIWKEKHNFPYFFFSCHLETQRLLISLFRYFFFASFWKTSFFSAYLIFKYFLSFFNQVNEFFILSLRSTAIMVSHPHFILDLLYHFVLVLAS